MKVMVEHFNQLEQAGDQRTMQVELARDATIGDLSLKLGLKQEEVGVLIVNGKQAIWKQKLKENDLVTLIPYIGGG